MGNRNNRARTKKRKYHPITNSSKIGTPTADIQPEHNPPSDLIKPIKEDHTEDVKDPLFVVVKSEITSPTSDNEFDIKESLEIEPKIEPTSDVDQEDESDSISTERRTSEETYKNDMDEEKFGETSSQFGNKKRKVLPNKVKQPRSIHRKTVRPPGPNLNKIAKDEVNFQCDQCGDVFTKNKLFQRHLNTRHDVRPFACTEPHCDKTFYTPRHRQRHINNVHSDVRKYKCDLCEKSFAKSDNLKDHRTMHFPPTIPCTICGKLLRNSSSVFKHRASHGERLHKCDECPKAFHNAYTLQVHRRLHTGEKPFVCAQCGEAFLSKRNLKNHEKKHLD